MIGLHIIVIWKTNLLVMDYMIITRIWDLLNNGKNRDQFFLT